MISPGPRTLRRRSLELSASATREFISDEDAAALLLFYAVECSLKALYMQENNLKNTDDERAGRRSARSYVHNIHVLLGDLKAPASEIGRTPTVVTTRTQISYGVSDLHQAWRYGEKIAETDKICIWLKKVLTWSKDKL